MPSYTENGKDGLEDRPAAFVRAAQYVRMSTDHQKYSTDNQSEYIAFYAAQRGYEIVEPMPMKAKAAFA